jgi:microcystin-dependent protein
MSDPFLGEIRMCSFGFAPKGWALCNGQLLPINQNQALFALLGTMYGGNGQTNFALPDLRGRSPMHVGAQSTQGQRAGAEAVTLNVAQLPGHQHGISGTGDLANANAPGLALPAAKGRGGSNRYAAAGSSDVVMHGGSIVPSGSSQPHNNLQPYAVLSFCIAMQGIFPSRN